jgi:Lrp/AsnC family transcriptional regulator, leucine-responsive regulatory protein
MKKYSEELDNQDLKILRELQADSSLSNVELARRVHLSPPATHTRVKRLEQLGYIRGYVALLDRERIGFDMLCFITVTLQMHQAENVTVFQAAVAHMPEVLECYHVTGEHDYLLKVALHNRQDLQRFLMENLTPISCISRIQTSLALTEVKTTTQLPLS